MKLASLANEAAARGAVGEQEWQQRVAHAAQHTTRTCGVSQNGSTVATQPRDVYEAPMPETQASCVKFSTG